MLSRHKPAIRPARRKMGGAGETASAGESKAMHWPTPPPQVVGDHLAMVFLRTQHVGRCAVKATQIPQAPPKLATADPRATCNALGAGAAEAHWLQQMEKIPISPLFFWLWQRPPSSKAGSHGALFPTRFALMPSAAQAPGVRLADTMAFAPGADNSSRMPMANHASQADGLWGFVPQPRSR